MTISCVCHFGQLQIVKVGGLQCGWALESIRSLFNVPYKASAHLPSMAIAKYGR